jgi:hypothetical protein
VASVARIESEAGLKPQLAVRSLRAPSHDTSFQYFSLRAMEKAERTWLEQLIINSKFGARIRDVIPRLEEGFSNEGATSWFALTVDTLFVAQTLRYQLTGAVISSKLIVNTTISSKAKRHR